MLDDIKQLFIAKNGKLNNNYKLVFNKQNKELQDKILSLFPMYDDLGDKLKSVIENDFRHCPVCDESMSWKDKNKTCSKECAKISLVENQEKTNLERYGVRNPAQAEEFQLKMQQTNLEKYGVTHPLKNKESLDKMKQTNLEKYGVNWVSQNDEVWEKQRQTNLDRYGFEYSAQNKEIQKKNIETNLERYGVEYPLQSDSIMQKVIDTNIERYGETHHFKNKDIMNKWYNSHVENKINYIKNHLDLTISYETALKFPIDISREYSKDYLIAMLNFITNNIKPAIEIIRNEFANNQFLLTSKEVGYEFKSNGSSYEVELCEFLDSFNINYVKNVRNIISPLELDIYIPEMKIALEFNGSYWHSDLFIDKHYHQVKTKLCNEKNITLIHIHEYLYKNKSDIYKAIISAKLNLNNRIYARKCIVKEVPKQEEKDFLNKFHLQGFIKSNVCYGLYYNDDLLTLCSFGKSRFDESFEIELIRNCSKNNITVVGGLSRLIKYYKDKHNINNILCYSDASISFNKNSELTEPNYVWFKSNLYFSRYQTMKHKLPKLLENNFDKLLSETENMKNNGFHKIYDSGNYKTIL